MSESPTHTPQKIALVVVKSWLSFSSEMQILVTNFKSLSKLCLFVTAFRHVVLSSCALIVTDTLYLLN